MENKKVIAFVIGAISIILIVVGIVLSFNTTNKNNDKNNNSSNNNSNSDNTEVIIHENDTAITNKYVEKEVEYESIKFKDGKFEIVEDMGLMFGLTVINTTSNKNLDIPFEITMTINGQEYKSVFQVSGEFEKNVENVVWTNFDIDVDKDSLENAKYTLRKMSEAEFNKYVEESNEE